MMYLADLHLALHLLGLWFPHWHAKALDQTMMDLVAVQLAHQMHQLGCWWVAVLRYRQVRVPL